VGDETYNNVGGDAQVFGDLVQAGTIQNVYVNQPRRVPLPRQLPPEIPNFVDRDVEQRHVLRRAGEPRTSRPLLITLSGLSGVGKTTLGFRLARLLTEERGAEDSGVLYVDLDDLRRDGVVEVADVLGELLRDLGVDPDWLGRTRASRAKQYWDRTRDKRLIVVIDNVRFGSEAEPLLPASPKSVAILVSQGPLYDVGDGAAVDVPLDPLPDDHAVRLLAGFVGDARLAEEPEAIRELVRLCGGLPAALHVAARWVRRHRRRRVAQLLDGFGAELREKGVAEVEPVWDAAYHDLSEPARRLYRLLAATPALSLLLPAVTALLGEGPDTADAALEELESAGLMEEREGRLRMHALVRAHAGRRARGEAGGGSGVEASDGGGASGLDGGEEGGASGLDGGEEGGASGSDAGGGAGALGSPVAAQARRRLVRWYLRQAQRADRLAAGARMTFGEEVGPLPDVPDVEFGGKADAYRWLEAERHALYGCVRIAYEDGADAETWALCEPLWTHHLDHPHYADVIDAFRTGLAAARRAEHLAATVRMRCQLARPLWEQSRYEEAGRELDAAVGGAALLPGTERKLRASALEFRGKLHAVRRDWTAAVPDYEASRRVHEEIGNAYGVLLLTYLLGQAAAGLGQLDRAHDLLTQAHADALTLGRARMTARTGFELGRVLQRLERLDEARELYESALAAARDRESTFDEARVRDALGDLAEQAGDPASARTHREAAAEIRAREGGSVEG